MIEAFVYVDRGALVIEAADDYRSLQTTSAAPLDLGPDVGPWYLLDTSTIAWSRPPETIRQWRWVVDDPDAAPSERWTAGHYELTCDGAHVSHETVVAMLALLGAGPSEALSVRWFDEAKNNGDLSREIRIESAGWVSIEIRKHGYAPLSRVSWAGPGDFDADGAADVFDFLAFQTAFSDGEMVADYDRDGTLTLFDFLAFMGHH